MVNEEARKERHEKLKQANILLKNPSSGSAPTSFLRGIVQNICKDQNNNPMLGRFLKRVVGITAAFLIVSPIISTYQITEGSYTEQYSDSEFGLEQYNPDSAISDAMTEDGFLLKPSLNTTAGDRSGFSDIFMYTVEPGDTLSSIAQSFNLKKDTIMGENNIWNPNQLKVGSQLKILPVDGISYVVKKGDTVDKLAKKYKVEKGVILSQNQLQDETLIADATIIIPGAKPDIAISAPGVGKSAPSAVALYTGPKASGRLIFPTVGTITQNYHSGHLALDIANRSKGPIFAAAAGKVIKASYGWNGGYGNEIIIDHGNGMQTLYAHSEKLYVKEGQYVEQGQTIAWMGNTGNVRGATGIHLHFEVRIKGVKYNPKNFF